MATLFRDMAQILNKHYKDTFYDWLEIHSALFSRILQISPVCTTELGTVANYYPNFKKKKHKSYCPGI
jgi:alkyl hydroperoxide reductase subunit AhpC